MGGGMIPPPPAFPAGVCILSPGGLEHAGGIGRAMAYLIEQWPRADGAMPVTVIDTRGGGSLLSAPWFFLRALLRVVALRATGRARLLHVNIASRGSTARKAIVVLLCALLRLRFVLHLHGARFHLFHAGLPMPGKAIVRWMFRRADRVIVLGEIWRRFAIDSLGVAPGRIAVICNGVPAPMPRSSRPEGPAHIVFLGRLGERKGVPELLAALASDRVAALPWRATLAGDGERDRFRREAARLGIGARVDFPGWIGQKDAAALLADGDVFVLPSHDEGLPVAVLEAMAHGLATIATPVGALPEFLTHEDSVLFVPPGDEAALAEALERLLTAPEERRVLGARAHAVFRRHFDAAAVARSVQALYETVRDRRTPASQDANPLASCEG